MKIKKLSINYQNKLLYLKVIKTKNFNKTLYLNNFRIEEITLRLKQVFNIIYKYHINKKRILFVIPDNFFYNSKILKFFNKTPHIYISESTWHNGVISNQFALLKTRQKNQKTHKIIFSLLSKLKKHIDLVIVYDKTKTEIIRNELYATLPVPIISINSQLNQVNNRVYDYKIPGNSESQFQEDYFFSLLISILKKGNCYLKWCVLVKNFLVKFNKIR